MTSRPLLYFFLMALCLLFVGLLQSWSVAFSIINLCLISSLMALGVNIQWGYAGLFNVGTMGSAAIGGLIVVLISVSPVREAWSAGGGLIILSALPLVAAVFAILLIRKHLPSGKKGFLIALVSVTAFLLSRSLYSPAVSAIEAINPTTTGYLGGLGLPVLLSWVVAGFVAAGIAWGIGKISLGLRSDYLAIATLGISEILIAILKNEEWLTRGVKNVTGLPRPVPDAVDLFTNAGFAEFVEKLGMDARAAAIVSVEIGFMVLFATVLGILIWASERAVASPWGRMMRAIRANRDAAYAMGKNINWRHLQVFVIGSAVCGIAGAMLTTYEGQLTPASYNPLRFTFLIWVMVIVGGSGNNWGSVLGGFIIWFVWIEAEPLGNFVIGIISGALGEDSIVTTQLTANAAQARLVLMGVILLSIMRFAPRGLLPERN